MASTTAETSDLTYVGMPVLACGGMGLLVTNIQVRKKNFPLSSRQSASVIIIIISQAPVTPEFATRGDFRLPLFFK